MVSNTQTDETFRKVKIIALIIFSLSVLAYVYQYGRSVNQSYYRTFSVTGEGIVTSVPDIAQFSSTVVTEGGLNVAEVQSQNSEKMNAVIEFLKNQDIDAKDIKTQQYSVVPKYDYTPCIEGRSCPPPKITGYSVQQSVLTKVREMDKVGGLLSGVVEHGANTVSDISFVIDDSTKVKNNARELAIEDAQKQAQSIAKASGFRVGKLISLYEDSGAIDTPSPYASEMAAGDMKQVSATPSIEPGSNEQKVKMTITYEIR